MRALALAVLLGLLVAQPAAADRLPDPPPATAGPVIKVLDPGKGARKELRFTARKGLKKRLTMSMKMVMDMDMGGKTMKQDIPTMEMAFDMVVTEVEANGDIRYEMVFRRPKVLPNASTPKHVLTAMDDALKGAEGLKGFAIVTNRGFVKRAVFDVPDTAPAQLKQTMASMEQSMSQFAAPVPEEAVGIGAKWETATALTMNGLSIEQVATNKLVAMGGSTITLEISIVQSAKPQKFSTGGITADLESYAASGAGKTQFNLTALVPTSGKVAMKSEMKMGAAGQKFGMKMSLDMTMKSK